MTKIISADTITKLKKVGLKNIESPRNHKKIEVVLAQNGIEEKLLFSTIEWSIKLQEIKDNKGIHAGKKIMSQKTVA